MPLCVTLYVTFYGASKLMCIAFDWKGFYFVEGLKRV